MRRIIVFVLLPCLFLAGCGLSPVVESSLEAPSLPVPVPPESAALSEPELPSPKETEPFPSDPNVVTVHQETIPTRIENAERWEAFLAAAEQGVADGVTLRLVYEEGTFDLDLRCDGEVFTLVDEGHVTTCKYLLADEEDAPRPGAKYRRAVHYLLSDDPDMTWEQYFSRLVSSYALPGDEFPATASLFSVFDD